jgi:hypothetical protein
MNYLLRQDNPVTQSAHRTLFRMAVVLSFALQLRAADGEIASASQQANATNNAAAGDLDRLSKTEILKMIQSLSHELKQTRSELDQIKAERQTEKNQAASPPPVPSVPAPPVTPPLQEGAADAAKEQTEAEKERERLERERAIRSVQRSGVLLPRGQIEVEPSFTYSHYSQNLINVDGFAILPVLVIGDIQSLRIERDIFQFGLALRYGVLRNLQLDVSLPFMYDDETFTTQSAQNEQSLASTETSRNDYGIGDVQFGLSYQALHEHGLVPDVIVQGWARAPTGTSQFDINNADQLPQGTGVWGVRGGLTAIKTLDPAVVIFNAGYTYNFGRDFVVQQVTSNSTNSVATTYLPGGSIDTSLAVAVAMNPSFAINLGVLVRHTFATKLQRIGEVQGSPVTEAQFRFGFAWALSRNSAINFTAGAGLTEDTPDLTITIACPIKF